jgi:outer membrane lipoprotein SlyB
MRTYWKRLSLALFLAFAVVGTSNVALSDPPDHAKAHGWRKKNDKRYVGYTGRDWERDYGVLEGSCNRKEIGTVAGAVIGGVIGSKVGEDNRPVAIIVGAVLGAVIGREIGRDLDEGDRACVGHALELGKIGQPIRWVNDQTRVSYILTPLAIDARDPKSCRRFKIDAAHDGKARSSNQLACRDSTGAWKIS